MFSMRIICLFSFWVNCVEYCAHSALMDIFMLLLSLMMTYDLSNHTRLANYYLYKLPHSKGQWSLPLNQPDKRVPMAWN